MRISDIRNQLGIVVDDQNVRAGFVRYGRDQIPKPPGFFDRKPTHRFIEHHQLWRSDKAFSDIRKKLFEPVQFPAENMGAVRNADDPNARGGVVPSTTGWHRP